MESNDQKNHEPIKYSLAVTTYCTKSYIYALEAQAPLCIENLRLAGIQRAMFVMAGDKSTEVKEAFEKYARAMNAAGHDACFVPLDVACNANKSHVKQSNLVIAKLQHAAWNEARLRNVDYVWSLESDILPQSNALRSLINAVQFDDGYYSIASAAYANAEFLGGRGTSRNWISPNVYKEERSISPALQAKIDGWKKRHAAYTKAKYPVPQSFLDEWNAIEKEIEQQPPAGNVFELNGKGWKKRGWLTHAYAGIGKGAILPTDWLGLGCVLMNKKALSLAYFTNYNGEGTQDLYLCWNAWNPAGIKMAVVPHVLCDHVKLRRGHTLIMNQHGPIIKDRLEVYRAWHEQDGDYAGHLRTETREWFGL